MGNKKKQKVKSDSDKTINEPHGPSEGEKKLDKKIYEKVLEDLQIELVKL